MQRFVYPAIFYKDDDLYRVLFPDLELTAYGKVMEEAYIYAKEFLRQYFIKVLKYDFDFNYATDFEEVKSKCKKDDVVMLIEADITDKDLK